MPDTLPITLFRERHDPVAIAGPAVRFVAEPDLAVAKVQVLADDPDAWLVQATGFAAPAAMREVAIGGVGCAWLAPGEWLLTGPQAQVGPLVERCAAAAGPLGLVHDLSHARAAFELSGPAARTVLATHCPLDLDDREMPVGAAKRSIFSDTSFFLARLADRDGDPVYRLVFDQTMGGYATRLLTRTISGVPV